MKDDSKVIAVMNAVVVPDNRISVTYDEHAYQYGLTIQVTLRSVFVKNKKLFS